MDAVTVPENHGKPWSNDDLEFLKRNYHRKGSEWCAERLKRTRNSIWNAVEQNRDLISHPLERSRKHMSMTEAAMLCGLKVHTMAQAIRIWQPEGWKPLSYGSMVPIDWVEEYADRLRYWRETEELGWYTRPDIHRIFRKNASDIAARWARGEGTYGFAFIARVRMRDGMPRGRRRDGTLVHATHFNPWDVEALAKDILDRKEVIAPIQDAMLLALYHDWSREYIVEKPSRHIFFPNDKVCIGPVPRAALTWLNARGMTVRTGKVNKRILSDKGLSYVEANLLGREEDVLGWKP